MCEKFHKQVIFSNSFHEKFHEQLPKNYKLYSEISIWQSVLGTDAKHTLSNIGAKVAVPNVESESLFFSVSFMIIWKI